MIKSEYTVSQIYIYPVKSLPGISLTEAIAEERGFKHDRRWMIVDKENKFITQRLLSEMVFIKVKIENEYLIFNHSRKHMEELKVSFKNFPTKEIQVNIWEDYCLAIEHNKNINDWFSEALNFKCKLVYMPDSTNRKTSTKYFNKSKNVSFADGYPYLIIGQESLNYLNSKLSKEISIKNFRPNIVFSGGKPHDEDKWRSIKVGEHKFEVVKPCARCVITTIDSQSGNKRKEPLKTLNTYRKEGNKILFGQNAICINEGKIVVGNKIQVM